MIDLYFRSIEDEIQRSSFGDVGVIAASYLLMLAYVMLSLGRVRVGGYGANDDWKQKISHLATDVKVSLSLAGTTCVLLSIFGSVGLFGYLGVKTTLIIFQILPFLVNWLSYFSFF